MAGVDDECSSNTCIRLALVEGTKAIEDESAAAKAAKNVSDLVRFIFSY